LEYMGFLLPPRSKVIIAVVLVIIAWSYQYVSFYYFGLDFFPSTCLPEPVGGTASVPNYLDFNAMHNHGFADL
jgi:hypothetical protein